MCHSNGVRLATTPPRAASRPACRARTDFTTRYEMTWVDFLRDDTLLTGGIVNGVRSS